ncbi:unnamed protein product [Spirodela intermedia]|uniref:Uncharacterized protein n=1 Tax=Spirodela intermedia TaxID=51605 RepID=A0A7I8LJS2_SPIIN|nr:unnamed protein product [Spirodela intermedia]
MWHDGHTRHDGCTRHGGCRQQGHGTIGDCPSFNKRPRLNTIQQLNDEKETKEGINSFEIVNCLQPTQRQPRKRLVYIEAQVDKEIVVVMLDTGATSNFISLEEVQRIGPKVESTKTKFKVADSSMQPLARVVKGVHTKVGR